MGFSETIQALYRSEINCGCESFWDGGFEVWLGDYMNGHKASAEFEVHELDTAAVAWLDAAVREHFPNSGYARQIPPVQTSQ